MWGESVSSKILLVEDDVFLRDGLAEVLHSESFSVECASTASEAKKLLSAGEFDLAILDVMLPDGNGLDICASLRSGGSRMPILFLTACDDEIQVVRGLDAGGDDYVTKPFKLRELLSRVRALLRRTGSPVYESSGIKLDIGNMSVKKAGENVFVTPTEFGILSMLLQNNGIIVTRAQLLERIWDSEGNFIDDNTLSVHISRLREKIGAQHIATVRGVGYRWEESK